MDEQLSDQGDTVNEFIDAPIESLVRRKAALKRLTLWPIPNKYPEISYQKPTQRWKVLGDTYDWSCSKVGSASIVEVPASLQRIDMQLVRQSVSRQVEGNGHTRE